ncbi:alkaline phosphatase [Bacillus lacus]|uniref:Alkaline phosphatase n=1 Tax=Metabacillus lacus TaxID=1983721 RepID=A0A7X2J1L3_9BACI|nr:alkaline phosphatase [Metabacillus lacus]MRX73680.1 alkaline phosphatase [Metabacillus lacus]
MFQHGKKLAAIALAGTVAVGSLLSGTSSYSAKQKEPEAKNVIMMVMDGTSAGATTLARWYKGGPLEMDSIVTGGVRTHSAESAITDSAPAATALATGYKSNDKYVGILPDKVNSPGVAPVKKEDMLKPVANVLEGAKVAGKSTGIIATSEIQHATPAGFSAHASHRSNYGDIAEQQFYQGMDVVLGGGKDSLIPGTGRNNRADNENFLGLMQSRGYDFVETRDQLLNSKSKKIWGAFANGAMAYDMDRAKNRPQEPTLAEMTKKAIDTMSQNKKGFFLFVEGSKVDWAAHANDPIGIIGDVLAFDDAVGEALKFAKKDGNTMVIAVSDHGNSGITMGNVNTNTNYPELPVSDYIDPLKKATMTLEGAINEHRKGKSVEEAAKLYGLDNLNDKERQALTASKDLSKTFVELLSARANIGFSTGGHTGEDVFLYSYGPDRPFGLVDNTDIAKAMAKGMKINLDDLNKRMFVDAEAEFTALGATVTIDKSDKANPVLVVERNGKTARFLQNKNLMIHNGKLKELEGVNVYTNNKFYIPRQGVDIFKK